MTYQNAEVTFLYSFPLTVLSGGAKSAVINYQPSAAIPLSVLDDSRTATLIWKHHRHEWKKQLWNICLVLK